MRVFENGSQGNAGAWICSEFPEIHWIRSNFQTYAYGGPGWADQSAGLGPHSWKPYPLSTEGQYFWQKEHVMTGHSPLGAMYPKRVYHAWGEGVIGFMEGGGTIPWMGLVNKGLFDMDHPSWGGWSGRFTKTKTTNFWSRHGDIQSDEEKVAPFYTFSEASDSWIDPDSGDSFRCNYAPVWRWREAMYNDFKCRMDWCVQSYENANHQPVAAFNEDRSNTIIHLDAVAGETIHLDGSDSSDPDGDSIVFFWWQYQEAGNTSRKISIESPKLSKTDLIIPTDAGGKQIHIIFEIQDNNPIASFFLSTNRNRCFRDPGKRQLKAWTYRKMPT